MVDCFYVEYPNIIFTTVRTENCAMRTLYTAFTVYIPYGETESNKHKSIPFQ